MNITDDFAHYLETITGTKLGQTLYIGEAPSSNKAPDEIYWVTGNGGGIATDNITGEKTKLYSFNVFFRSRNYKKVYDNMQYLEEQLNCETCIDLTNYKVIEIKAVTLSIDSDLEAEDRKVGVLQVEILTYKGDC
jgi:hypothetical protein